MRLNRGTLLLVIASILIIAGMVVLNNQRAAAPDASAAASPTPSAGPIFPEIADVAGQSSIVRFEVLNITDGSKVVMTKDASGVWTVAEATNPQQLATDQTKAVGTMSVLASLAAADKFETDNLAQFGLDAPRYDMKLTDADGKVYRLQIGGAAVANPRYYGLVNEDAKTVYVLPRDLVDGLIGQIAQPAYVPSPTPTATLTATANPFSEVEQTATAGVELQQIFATMTSAAQATAGVGAEATAEASAAPTNTLPPTATVVPSATPRPPTSTPRPTTAPTAEATPESTPAS
jgi:hypothetical protein